MANKMSSPLTVLRFSCWHFSLAGPNVSGPGTRNLSKREENVPSLVMKEMNSLTHSCMHSFASFAIFAFSGKAIFMMRATGAKLRMLASVAAAFVGLELVCGGEELDCGEADDMARLQGGRLLVHRELERW